MNYNPFTIIGYVDGRPTGRRIHAWVTQEPRREPFVPCTQGGPLDGQEPVFVDGPVTCGRCVRLLREQPHKHQPCGIGWPRPGQGRPFGRSNLPAWMTVNEP